MGLLGRRVTLRHVATACAGLSLGFFSVAINLSNSVPLFLGILLLLATVILSPKSNASLHPGVTGLLGALVALSLLAAVFPARVPDLNYHKTTLAIGVWVVLMFMFYLRPLTFNSLAWSVPFWLTHAAVTTYQGITHTAPVAGRADGLTGIPNIAGGFLVIGILYLAFTRHRWLALPLVVALPFTGTRLAVIVLVVLLVLMALPIWRGARVGRPWLFAAVCIIVLATTQAVFGEETKRTSLIRLVGGFDVLLDDVVTYRMQGQEPIPADTNNILAEALRPHGYIGPYGVHSVPLRLFWELGLLGSVAWGAATLILLFRRIGSPVWWVFLSITLLSTLDYYTWMPLSVSAFWWLCASVLARE